jgi:hypothetical protein
MSEQYNTANSSSVRRARKSEKIRRDEELEDLRIVMKTKPGRRLLWRMFGECGIFSSSFTKDPHTTNFNEGKRSIGLFLLTEVGEADPKAMSVMMTEARGEDYVD